MSGSWQWEGAHSVIKNRFDLIGLGSRNACTRSHSPMRNSPVRTQTQPASCSRHDTKVLACPPSRRWLLGVYRFSLHPRHILKLEGMQHSSSHQGTPPSCLDYWARCCYLVTHIDARRELGVAHAARFTWQQTAFLTAAAYRQHTVAK